MESRFDARIKLGRRAAKRKPIPGGKVLQRLFAYQEQRDPALNTEFLASTPVQKDARAAFGLSAKVRRTPAASAARRGAAGAASKFFAASIIKAASGLSKGRSRARAGRAARAVPERAMIARALAPAPVGAAPLWKSIGPTLIPNGQTYGSNTINVSGRVSSIAIDPGNPKHILCGAAGGGVWETADAGAKWEPRTDQMPTLAIGAIAFDPTKPKVVYAGSGEGNFYAALGAGVYRSLDGGTNWKVLASSPFVGAGFYDLVVDPKDGTRLYAATTSGFYASSSGGSTWTLKRSGKCWDISLHPSGGPSAEILATFADGLFVSTNGGTTFTKVILPAGPAGLWTRLAVDRVTASPDIAYAFGASGSSAYLWRRTGTTWTKITTLPAMNITQAWYDWYVAAAPNDKGLVYLGAIDTYRGALSGSTWTWKDITTQGSKSIHPDQHCLTFEPGTPKTFYAGNDGGVYRTKDGGATWTALNNTLGITEIEYMASDPTTPKWLMAGTQDNGTIAFTGTLTWNQIAQGDGGDCGVNQINPNEIHHSFYGVSLQRSANKGITWTNLSPPPMAALFYPPVEVFGPVVAIGGVALDVSQNAGNAWTQVALALPSGDAASAMDIPGASTIFIGTMQGRVMKVAWNGSSWVKTVLTSPAAGYISCLSVDPGTSSRLWVTLGTGRVYRSDDTGLTWKNCTANLPAIPKNSVAVDPANGKHVWVAADVGVYETTNMGLSWTSFSNGLPNAMAVDLVFHKTARVLFCGTRNRGAWVVQIP